MSESGCLFIQVHLSTIDFIALNKIFLTSRCHFQAASVEIFGKPNSLEAIIPKAGFQ